ncbi:MAG: hypothetical protein RLZZ69_2454 [Cyanobacteriota bacterium]|jgi:hypothetical protein
MQIKLILRTILISIFLNRNNSLAKNFTSSGLSLTRFCRSGDRGKIHRRFNLSLLLLRTSASIGYQTTIFALSQATAIALSIII